MVMKMVRWRRWELMDWQKKKNENKDSARHQADKTGWREKNRKKKGKISTDSGLLKWFWSGVVEVPSRINVPVGWWSILTDLTAERFLRSDELALNDKEGWEILNIHYTNELATKNGAEVCVEVPGSVLRRRWVSAELAADFQSLEACRSQPVHPVHSELALSGCTRRTAGIIAQQRSGAAQDGGNIGEV